MRTCPTLVLALALLGAAPPDTPLARAERRADARALPYLDFRMKPRPIVADGAEPNHDDYTYSWRRCTTFWAKDTGALRICSACYKHPAHYLGQAIVKCPLYGNRCEYVANVPEEERYQIDFNQCYWDPPRGKVSK